MNGKEKAARVDPGYHETIGRRRVRWAWGIGVASVLVAIGFVVAGQWKQVASPGPVHFAHAAWEDNCSACHAPFEPSSWRNGLHGILGTGQASDALCQKCHAGPPHHAAREAPADAMSCAGCHVDHRGRYSRLASVADKTCTACHSDLSAHLAAGEPQYLNVTSFAKDHPQFHLGSAGTRKQLGKQPDPGRLKFNHAMHLTPGQKYNLNDVGGWSLGRIPSRYRERYREAQPADRRNDSDLVTLNCASCHQFDATDAPPATPGQRQQGRSSGAYALPVTYEQHCAACHSLTFDPALPDVSIPHHLQADEVRRFLQGTYAGKQVQELAGNFKDDGRPLPGVNLSLVEQAARRTRDAKVANIENLLFAGTLKRAESFVFTGRATCGMCHEFAERKGNDLRILPVNVPAVWFPHGKFSHQAHRAMDCLACHEGAAKSTTNKDVLLPGVENCRECHAPKSGSGVAQRGGVRHDCVTCHQYHHGTEPLSGRGAKARGVEWPQGVEGWLRGN